MRVILGVYDQNWEIEVDVGLLEVKTSPFLSLVPEGAHDERIELFLVDQFG